MSFRRLVGVAACFFASLLIASAASAQFDPARVQAEPEAVAARFPDPALRYDTPAFDPQQPDFTSHTQTMAQLDRLAERPDVRVELAGASGLGQAIAVVLLAEGRRWRADRPTLMVVAQQHGNEPAPGEAVGVLLERWSDAAHARLLRRVNVVVLPRANPDGAALFKRGNAQALDVNRDHLLLRTPEARAIAQVATRYRPQVVLDLHEAVAGDRWVDVFDAWTSHDLLLQGATTPQLAPALQRAAERTWLPALRAAAQAEGLRTDGYHTPAADRPGTVVMGGVGPELWRNAAGLRGAVALLLESRGIGLGKQHLQRRVHSHVVVAERVLREMAARGPALLALGRQVDRAVVAQACRGQLVLAAEPTPQPRALTLIDRHSGQDRTVQVDWHAAQPWRATQQRARPCGYWLAADQLAAVNTLRDLGLRVEAMPGRRQILLERYQMRSDKATALAGDGAAPQVQGLQRARADLPAGWWVSLAQPLAPLAAAALEPDAPGSLVAAQSIRLAAPGQPERLLRVLQRLDRPQR